MSDTVDVEDIAAAAGVVPLLGGRASLGIATSAMLHLAAATAAFSTANEIAAGPPATAPAKGTGPFSKLIKYALVGAAALVIAVVALYWWVHRRPPAGSDRPSTATAGPTTTATPEPDPSAEAPAPLAG